MLDLLHNPTESLIKSQQKSASRIADRLMSRYAVKDKHCDEILSNICLEICRAPKSCDGWVLNKSVIEQLLSIEGIPAHVAEYLSSLLKAHTDESSTVL